MTRRLASRNRYTPGASGIVPEAGRKLVDRRTTVARLRRSYDASPRSRDRYRLPRHGRGLRWQRLVRRPLGDRPVGDVELAAVARADDLATDDPGDQASLMGARGREGLELAGDRLDHDDVLLRVDR